MGFWVQYYYFQPWYILPELWRLKEICRPIKKKEFEAANKNQQKQIRELEKANQHQQVAALRTELIKFLNSEVAIEEKYKSELHDRRKEITTKGVVNPNEVKELERFSKQITDSFNRRLNLRNIATYLIAQNFRTVDELRDYFNTRYEKFVKEFGRTYTWFWKIIG